MIGSKPFENGCENWEFQWRRQAWGTGARAPWSLLMHANLSSAVLNGTLCSRLTHNELLTISTLLYRTVSWC